MTPTTPSAPDEVVLDRVDALLRKQAEVESGSILTMTVSRSSIYRAVADFLLGARDDLLAPLRASPQPAGVTEEQVEEVAAKVANEIAAAVMGNDHLVHLLDEQQADEVHGDIQIEAVRRIRTALEAARLPSPTDTRERVLTAAEYEAIHRAGIDAYEAATPKDYRYSATALRKAIDAARAVEAAIKPLYSHPAPSEPVSDGLVRFDGVTMTPAAAANRIAELEHRSLAEGTELARVSALSEAARIAHNMHLGYAAQRDSLGRDTVARERMQARTDASAEVWRKISALIPRDPAGNIPPQPPEAK